MLIHIDDSVAAGYAEITERERGALQNLALAGREGAHFILASRNLSGILSKDLEIGPRERSFYRDLHERYSTISGIRGIVSCSIRACKDASTLEASDDNEIRVPLDYFSTLASVRPALLVCEHLSDCSVLREMAQAYGVIVRSGSGVRINFENRLGGGSNLAAVTEAVFLEGNRILLIVVDSDRKTPNGALGSTSLAAQRIFNQNRPNQVAAKFVILRGKELENLLPDDFYRSEFDNSQHHSDSVKFMCSLTEHGFNVARLHVDIKEGLKVKQLFVAEGLPQDFSEVWTPVLNGVAETRLSSNQRCVTCANSFRCQSEEDCQCVLMMPHNSNLLEKGAEAWKRDKRSLWMSLSGPLRDAAIDISNVTFDWGCATRILAT